MQVQSIKSPNFEKKYISPQAKETLSEVLQKMKRDSVYPNENMNAGATIVSGLRINGKRTLFNFLLDNDETYFTLENNLQLKVNSETGRVRKEKAPFFSRTKNFIPEIEETINGADNNYNNPDIVQKLTIEMPSKEWFEKIEKLADIAKEMAITIDNYLKTAPFLRWFS